MKKKSTSKNRNDSIVIARKTMSWTKVFQELHGIAFFER